MRAFLTLTWTETKLFLREPMATFFTVAFPLLLLFAFGAIFGNAPGSAPGDVGYTTYALPGYVALTIGSLGLLSLPTALAIYRDQGVLRRFRVTPLRPTAVLGAQTVVHVLMLLGSVVLLMGTAGLVYDVPVPDRPFLALASLLLAALSFLAVGFLLAAVVPTARAAQAVGNALFFPMLFLSGAAVPQFLFPEWLKTASAALPLTHATWLLQDAWLHGQWNGASSLVLVGMGIGCASIGAYAFRWS
ncbi:MAG: ABC transporter permease [Salinibacter sp.]|uniref:ABC transporter permease n=1 Tax=Salinibacter sp. TaxID=2065818 RepID=UPI0035D4AF7E